MKIVTLLGSPRTKGNSAAIAGRFIETAENLGAETKTFTLIFLFALPLTPLG